MGSAIFLFLNVEFTDSSLKMSRTVKKSIEPFLIYLFSVQIHNQHLQKPIIKNPPTNPLSVGRSVRIPVKAKSIMKIWNSLGVFFSYIIYYKIYLYFCNGYLKVQNLFSVWFIFKKTYVWWWQFSQYSYTSKKKFEKNHPYERSQEHLFRIITMPKIY